MRGRGFRLVGGLCWADRRVLELVAQAFRRRLAMDDRAVAYRRRVKLRGRGTPKGQALAVSVFKRWKLLQPARAPRPEALA